MGAGAERARERLGAEELAEVEGVREPGVGRCAAGAERPAAQGTGILHAGRGVPSRVRARREAGHMARAEREQCAWRGAQRFRNDQAGSVEGEETAAPPELVAS